jgi:Rieske Fe-S protein
METRATRRSLLDVLLGAGLVGFLSSIVYPVLRYLKPIAPQEGAGALRLSKEDQAKLEKDHTVIVRHGAKRLLVFEDPQQRICALEAKCTHEGCTVQYVPGDSLIWCACHNGKFDLEGRVLSGPPPRPLAKWQAQRDADGAVTVAPSPTTDRA